MLPKYYMLESTPDQVINELSFIWVGIPKEGYGVSNDAIELKTATVHWLRHTGISEDVKFRPREHVRDDAGHASMATTDRYIDSDLRERHESGRKKRIKDIY